MTEGAIDPALGGVVRTAHVGLAGASDNGADAITVSFVDAAFAVCDLQ